MPGAWSRFFRVRLLPTAISNLLLGMFLAAHGEGELEWLRVSLALPLAAFLYLLGMGMNDLHDRERDRTLHPERPLATKALPVKRAELALRWLVLGCVALAACLDVVSLILTLVLLAWISLYNLVTKDRPFLGPATMGLVRSTLVLLGAAAATAGPAFPARVWLAAVLVGGYVALLTFYSMEEERARPRALRFRLALISVELLLAAGLTLWETGIDRTSLLAWSLPLLWCLIYAARPLREVPPRASAVTFQLLLGLFPLDLAMLLSYDLVIPASFCVGLWLLAWRPLLKTKKAEL